ncbi:MAG: hypothetical protein GY851_34640, partial [bacterium]|nr:hypothetical protein [bacterium]
EGYGATRTNVDTHDAVDNRLDVGILTLPVANLSISGRVVDTQGNAMPYVPIEGSGEGQPSQCRTETDYEGHFVLDKVCAGQMNLRVRPVRGGKRLSARVITRGGATDIRIVVREGRPPVQYVGGKSYEQIVESAERLIDGVAVDEKGAPIANVPVGVCCHKTEREPGKFSWMYSSFPTLKATTDAQGRFAIELEDDGQYNLRFSPDRHAAVIAYDIPVGKKDLKVTLPEGGVVAGRLMRLEKGRKVPIANAEVKIEQVSRSSFAHLGFDRDRTTTTDAEGQFRFEHIRTKVRPGNSRSDEDWTPIPRVWQIVHGDTTQTVAFSDGAATLDVEVLVKPKVEQSTPLTGNPLPGFGGIRIDPAAARAEGKAMLICFFDMQQRPSRHCIAQLAKQAESLTQKGVAIVAIQAAAVDDGTLETWV